MMPGHFKRYTVLATVFIIASSFGLYFRLYPAGVNIRHRSLELSRLIVLSNLQRSLSPKDVTLPSGNIGGGGILSKKAILSSLSKADRKKFELSVKGLAENIASSKKFYLPGADPYYYYHLTKNLLSRGKLSEKISNGKFFDPLMTAPLGSWRNFEIHPYTGFLLYKMLHTFSKNITLYSAVAIVPLALYLFCMLPFILSCLCLRTPPKILLISCIFFALSPIFIQRSCIGWYDTDPYNVMFPLAALFFLSKIFKEPEKLIWAISLSLVTGIFSVFWQGWLILTILVLAALLAGCLFNIFTKKNPRPILIVSAIYLLCAAAITALLITPRGLATSLSEVLEIARKFSFMDFNIWPDVFLTIGELKRASLLKIMYLSGGPVFVFFAIWGFFVLLLKRDKTIPFEFKISICLFTLAFAIMSSKGERFSIFFIGPASLCFAAGLNSIFRSLRNKLLFISKGNRHIVRISLVSFLFLLSVSPITMAHITSLRINPIFNEVWDAALTRLNSLSPKNSIINSWWPPGHFIRAIAERGVTFDGATPEVPQSFWIARFFMSDNENSALGIIRMLNTSGNKAVEFLVSEGFPLDKAVEIIEKLVSSDAPGALEKAGNFLPKDKAEYLVSLTHGAPPPSFCFVYNDLIKNVLGMHYVDQWDFTKAISVRERTSPLSSGEKIFTRGTKENIDLMWKISGGLVYIGEESFQTREKDGVIFFYNGVSLNTSEMTANISSLEGQISGTPESIILPVSGGLSEKKMENAMLKLSILFIRRPEGRSSCIVAPSRVLRSVIFRLYYLNGLGLPRFEPFILEEEASLNTKIMVYKVNWTKI